MKYCADCGTGHECEAETPRADPAVEIARLETKRDIEVARINRGLAEAELETEAEVAMIEAESGVAQAEAVADALTDVLSPPEPEPAPDAAPIVIEDTQDETPADRLPPRDEREHSGGGGAPAAKRGFF